MTGILKDIGLRQGAAADGPNHHNNSAPTPIGTAMIKPRSTYIILLSRSGALVAFYKKVFGVKNITDDESSIQFCGQEPDVIAF